MNIIQNEAGDNVGNRIREVRSEKRKAPCKQCMQRPRQHASSRCKQCSEQHLRHNLLDEKLNKKIQREMERRKNTNNQ